MGSVHTAHCACGFSADVTVGGDMETFATKSLFPFYCDACGLVEVNISADTRAGPKRGSPHVKQYGQPPVSLPFVQHEMAFDWFGETVPERGNLCPSCKKMTLTFDPVGMLFD